MKGTNLTTKTLKKNDLIEKFHKLVAKRGWMWKEISDDLNKAGITTSTGHQWTRENVERFYKRHCTENPQRVVTKTSPTVPQPSPTWMDASALADLRIMLEEWRTRKDVYMREIQARPIFKGLRRNSGFHVNDAILKRAMEKVKTDKVYSGGSLSLLVERLLWQYIGSPEDLLEQ